MFYIPLLSEPLFLALDFFQLKQDPLIACQNTCIIIPSSLYGASQPSSLILTNNSNPWISKPVFLNFVGGLTFRGLKCEKVKISFTKHKRVEACRWTCPLIFTACERTLPLQYNPIAKYFVFRCCRQHRSWKGTAWRELFLDFVVIKRLRLGRTWTDLSRICSSISLHNQVSPHSRNREEKRIHKGIDIMI